VTGSPIVGAAVARLWRDLTMPEVALPHLELTGADPVVPSSFAAGAAAQASLGAAVLAAAELWHLRTGRRQTARVDMRAAALECFCHFSLDGVVPPTWDKLSGLYRCDEDGGSGHVRIHANFAHHRDRALAVLGLPAGEATERAAVEAALARWRADDFEQAAAEAGAVIAAVRSFADWDRHPQAAALADLPTMSIERIGDAPARALPRLAAGGLPLAGVRVLDLTRILAGPVAGRTLAAYGADVLLVNSPSLPNIAAIAETSRGKLSAHVDLATAAGRARLAQLVAGAHVFIQGYRPGAIAAHGFAAEQLAELSPGIVAVSLSAYGHVGPWRERRGFDSLVQTATGFNHAEAAAFGASTPKALPMQILDYASGFLMAFGAAAALIRQQREGGSWHVRVALAQTARWLRSLGRVADGPSAPAPSIESAMRAYPSGFGRLMAVPHAAELSETPPRWSRPSMPPGSHEAAWPDA